MTIDQRVAIHPRVLCCMIMFTLLIHRVIFVFWSWFQTGFKFVWWRILRRGVSFCSLILMLTEETFRAAFPPSILGHFIPLGIWTAFSRLHDLAVRLYCINLLFESSRHWLFSPMTALFSILIKNLNICRKQTSGQFPIRQTIVSFFSVVMFFNFEGSLSIQSLFCKAGPTLQPPQHYTPLI